jgi:hypothetical protein
MQQPAAEAERSATTVATGIIGADESLLYCAVWALAASSSLLRAVRDDDYRHIIGLGSVAGISGFLAVAVVSILRFGIGLDSDSNGFCLGLACLVGLLGREQDKLIRLLFSWVLRKWFGIEKLEE